MMKDFRNFLGKNESFLRKNISPKGGRGGLSEEVTFEAGERGPGPGPGAVRGDQAGVQPVQPV